MSFAQSKLIPCSEPNDAPSLCKLVPEYSRNIPPTTVPPMVLSPKINLREVIQLDEIKKTISLYVDLYVAWQDKRLAMTAKNASKIPKWFHIHDLDLVWNPTFSFGNVLNTQKVSMYGGEKIKSLWFQPPEYENDLEYAEELIVTVSCNLDFANYPFDENECPFFFGDLEYTISDIVLNSVKLSYHNLNTNESGDPIMILDANIPYNVKVWVKPSFTHEYNDNEYSSTGIVLVFYRKTLGHLLGSFYMPTLMFAAISTVSFFIHPSIVPGRMGMVVTIFLITSNIYTSVDAPPSRGFSYIEIWMVGVQAPILYAILEYGVVLALSRKSSSATKIKASSFLDEKEVLFDIAVRKIDSISLICCLIFLFCFTTTYCLIGMS